MKLLLLILFSLFFTGCSKDEPRALDEDATSYQIIVATDLHYAASHMTAKTDYVENLTLKADGKQLNYLTEITDAFLDEVKTQKPDLLVLSGDLTMNGEKESHEDLAKKLAEVEKNGVEVLIVPGNHDINSYNALKMGEDKSYYVDYVTPKDFNKIYREFGYSEAYSKDEHSLSYVYRLSNDFQIVLLDTSLYEQYSASQPMMTNGALKEETLAWLEEQLKEAKDQNMDVLMVMHHNLLVHSPLLYEGYTLDNADELLELCLKYDVKLNLSGHIHVQDIASYTKDDKTIYDIVTSALSIYQNQYGLLTYTPHDSFDYQVKSTDVEAYARQIGSEDENLLDFLNYSYECFEYVNMRKSAFNLLDAGYPEDDRLYSMAYYNGKMRAYYFTGLIDEYREELLNDPAYDEWEKHYGNKFENSSIYTTLSDMRTHRNLKIELSD